MYLETSGLLIEVVLLILKLEPSRLLLGDSNQEMDLQSSQARYSENSVQVRKLRLISTSFDIQIHTTHTILLRYIA